MFSKLQRPSISSVAMLWLVALFITNSGCAWAMDAAGKTVLVKGDVNALDLQKQDSRALTRRAPVFQVDQVNTGNDSETQLRMLDGALIALAPQSSLKIEEYRLQSSDQKGSVVMELLEGGLRTVSGTIKGQQGDYQLKTPVGSIGIRGTYYQVQIKDGKLLIAVWEGNIDIAVQTPNGVVVHSYGSDHPYSFASISADGIVTDSLTPPDGLFFDNDPDITVTGQQEPDTETQSVWVDSEFQELNTETPTVTVITTQTDPLGYYDNSDFLTADTLTPATVNIADLIANQTGASNYGSVQQAVISSSNGVVTDFNVNFAIDFDNGTVDAGVLNMTDNGGEWFAVFDGIINVDQLELGVNFASHGNNRATGEVKLVFGEGLDALFGQFELWEIAVPSVRIDGSFLIK